MSLTAEFKNAINLIKRSQKFLILPSAPPDGDSIGSALALFFALKKLGKEVTAVCHDPIPDVYKFLHPRDVIKEDVTLNQDFIVTLDCEEAKVDHIRYQVEHNKVNIVITPKQGNFRPQDVSFHYGQIKYDAIIIVDTGDLQQLGPIYSNNPEIFFSIPVINIDHHASNSYFGNINIVDITSASATQIVFEFLNQLSPQKNLIDEQIATALLAGIITDTGSFQHTNTTPRSLEVAAELVNLGASQQEIIKNVYKTKQLSTLKLWGRVLSKLKVDKNFKIIWSVITKQDFEETKSHPDEIGDIIDDLLTNDPDAEVVLILKEKKQGLISGSVRTTTNAVDASRIAEIFGGGGHARAAGFRIESQNIPETEELVIKTIRNFLKPRLTGEPALQIPSSITPADIKSSIAEKKVELSVPTVSLPPPILQKKFRNGREERIKKMTKEFFGKKPESPPIAKETPSPSASISVEKAISTNQNEKSKKAAIDKDVTELLQKGLQKENHKPKYKFGN